MKSILFVTAILFTTSLSAQTSNKEYTYTGKIGISTIEFKYVHFPSGSTAIVKTGDKSYTYSNCTEDPAAKFQKLCFYNRKEGFDKSKSIQVQLSASEKNPPKQLSAIYTVNGVPVKFRLVRN